MNSKNIFAIGLHMLLWAVFLAGYKCIGNNFGVDIQKFGIGFAVGTYALLAKEVAKYFLSSLFRRRWPFLDDNIYFRWLLAIGLTILMGTGLYAWYISWEGKTGWVFGLGVFGAALLFDAGIARLFSNGEPFGRSKSRGTT